MCGRFVVARASAELAAELDIAVLGDDLPAPSFNIAPTSRVPLVVQAPADAPQRRLEAALWGLVPGWAKDARAAARAFNARSETAAEKPTFRTAVKKRRGVIPADGYYEWHTTTAGKQPYFVHPAGPEPLLFAALYDWWRDPDGGWLLSASILTRASAGAHLAWLHERTPVFVARNDMHEWLDPATAGSAEMVAEFAQRSLAVADTLDLHPVDRRVGSVRENDPQLIAPLGDPPA